MPDERKPKQKASGPASGRARRSWTARAVQTPVREEASSQAWRSTIRRRTLVVFAFIALWLTGVQARLVHLQVVEHDIYLAAAVRQQQSKIDIEALRGDIVDRNGELLAYSVRAHAIFADPSIVDDPKATAADVCRALGDCSAKERASLEAKLDGPGQHVYIRRSRQVTPAQVERVAALKLPGVGLARDTGRYYPQGPLAAHILGWVGQDNEGQAGIELVLEQAIRGQPGVGHAQVDNQRRSVETRIDREPLPGANIELTIDTRIQYVAEQALKAGVDRAQASGGVALVMDPHSGELYAMASYPTYDPNRFGQSLPDQRKNRATQDVYEPGSTFKMITATAAFEEGIVDPNELIDTNPGYYKFPGRKPITESSGHNYGVLTFAEALVKSSNVAAVKVGLRLGGDVMSRYVRRFGFAVRSSRDFQGQSRGIWNPIGLTDSGLGSVSMGYQISVTPLQMVAAVSAVANGGLLIEPRVVRAIERNGVRQRVAPNVVRRVMKPETAAVLTEILKDVVDHGTATRAQMAGYPAAGKTGTSRRVLPTGGYSSQDYNASFAGFVPADRPRLAILVLVDSPRGAYYGGTVAAPIFKEIAETALLQLGVTPIGDGHAPVSVRAGRPTGQTRLTRVADKRVSTPVVIAAAGPMAMPDLRGLSLRQALRELEPTGLMPRISGAGFVTAQMPEPGASVTAETMSVLSLRREDRRRNGDPR